MNPSSSFTCGTDFIAISKTNRMKQEIDNTQEGPGKKQTTNTGGNLSGKRDVTDNAREEAMGDIEEDADLSTHSPNDDLDEGETARLGEDNDVI